MTAATITTTTKIYLIFKTNRKNSYAMQTCFRQCKESFSKGFMIVSGFFYNWKIKNKKTGENVKRVRLSKWEISSR